MPDQTMPPPPDTRPTSSVRRAVRIHQEDSKVAMFVDDLDVASTVMRADIALRPGVAEIELKLIPGLFELDIDHADVAIDVATRAVLLKLGWTPPADTTPPAEGNPRD